MVAEGSIDAANLEIRIIVDHDILSAERLHLDKHSYPTQTREMRNHDFPRPDGSMHIAQFIHRYPPALGGSEQYFSRLASYLTAQGDQVTTWTTTAIDLQALWQPGFQETSEERGGVLRRYRPWHFPGRRYLLKALSLLPWRRWQCLTLPSSPFCPAMWREAGRYGGRLDAVHAAAFPYSFPIVCGLRLARRRRVPFFLTPFLHLGDPENPSDPTRQQYSQPALRWLLCQADRVFVQTPSELAAAKQLGVADERLILQGLGVDPAECSGGDRHAARARWGVLPSDFVVGHLANLSQEKGSCDLLHTLRAGLAPSVRLVLAGPRMPNFSRCLRSLADSPQLLVTGPLSDHEKRDFYAGIDLFVLPSRSDSFGLVLLEAWANGKPVLAYRAGGPAELVHHEEDGWLVRCGAIADLAAFINRLNADRQRCQEVGLRGQQRICREFSWPEKLQLVREQIRAAVAANNQDGNRHWRV